MKLNLKTQKFQQGGAAPDPTAQQAPTDAQAAPQQGGQGQDPLMPLAQMAAQALQSGDCNSMAAVCQGFLELIQQASQGGGSQQAPQGEPVYAKGGKILRRL